MKKSVLTALGVALGIVCVFADNKPTQPQPPTKPNKGTIPIFIRKGKHLPIKYAPSVGVTMTATVTESGMTFNFPFAENDYPMNVELELQSEPYGFWTAIFMDASSCELEFDVTVGDYHISVTTSEYAEYTGYFTLE